MIDNLTELFLDQIFEMSKLDLMPSLVIQAKKCMLDYLGATFAGSEIQKNKLMKLLDLITSENEEVSVIGFNRKSDLKSAVFLNGLSSHVADFDDGANSGIIHIGSPVFSTLIPLAEKEHISPERFLRGVIVGYETSLRLANSIQPSHKKLGYHATGTCGTIGSSIAACVSLNFSKVEMKNAFSSAIVAASGTLKVLEDGSELKPYNVGRASLVGFLSAIMGRAGFAGPDDVLLGDNGFFSMMTKSFEVSHLKKRKDTYAIEKVYFKPYAACRYCHPAIEAAIKIRPKIKFAYDNIKEVNVKTYVWAVAKHDHADIQGITSAKMSIPYSVAVALYSGKADIEEFEIDRIKNSDVLSLAKKVKVAADDELTSLFPQKSAAIVELVTNDGASFVERVDYPKGEPENPLSEEEIKDKFMTLAMYGNKTKEEAEKIIECVWDLENRLGDLFDLL